MNHRSGITLIETLIALAISSFLLLGLMTVFTQTRTVYRAAERLARLHENLRFSQALIREDVRLADYWGRTQGAENLVTASGVRISCRKRDVTRWALDVSQAVEINDESYALPCPGTRPSEQSDVLVVRHARAATAATPGTIRIQSNAAGGILFSDSANVLQSRSGAKIFGLSVNAYYVSSRSNHDPESPALRRLTLVHGVMQDQEIISGISNLQVQLGLDTDGDNRADTYVDGGHVHHGRPGNHVVAVRLQLTARSQSPAEPQAVVTQTVFLRNARRTAQFPGPT
jgi:type IV pilus assembly protein PilW